MSTQSASQCLNNGIEFAVPLLKQGVLFIVVIFLTAKYVYEWQLVALKDDSADLREVLVCLQILQRIQGDFAAAACLAR